MNNRQNFERIKLYDQRNGAGEPRADVELSLRSAPDLRDSEPSLALSVLLTEVLLPILERVNESLDELEAAVNRIADAPHGHDHSCWCGSGNPSQECHNRPGASLA